MNYDDETLFNNKLNGKKILKRLLKSLVSILIPLTCVWVKFNLTQYKAYSISQIHKALDFAYSKITRHYFCIFGDRSVRYYMTQSAISTHNIKK